MHHVVQRCVAGRRLWHDEEDAGAILADLRESAATLGIAVHAYNLLPDHLHLLLTPAREAGPGALLQALGRRSVRAMNRRHAFAGSLWQGRHRSTVLDAGAWLLDCMRFVECNPNHGQFPPALAPGHAPAYSSLAHHIGLGADPLVTDHALYWALGNTPFERQAQYLRIVSQPLAAERAAAISDATRHGWPLGDEAFLAELARHTERRLVRRRPGRPARAAPAGAAR